MLWWFHSSFYLDVDVQWCTKVVNILFQINFLNFLSLQTKAVPWCCLPVFAWTSAAAPGARIQGPAPSLILEDTVQPTCPAQNEEAPGENWEHLWWNKNKLCRKWFQMYLWERAVKVVETLSFQSGKWYFLLCSSWTRQTIIAMLDHSDKLMIHGGRTINTPWKFLHFIGRRGRGRDDGSPLGMNWTPTTCATAFS